MKRKEAPKVVRAVRMPKEYWQRLQAIYERTGATPGEQIRRGVALWLDYIGDKR